MSSPIKNNFVNENQFPKNDTKVETDSEILKEIAKDPDFFFSRKDETVSKKLEDVKVKEKYLAVTSKTDDPLQRVAKLHAKKMKELHPQIDSEKIAESLQTFYIEFIPNVIKIYEEIFKDPLAILANFRSLLFSNILEGVDEKTKSRVFTELSPVLKSTIDKAESMELAVEFKKYLNEYDVRRQLGETNLKNLLEQLNLDNIILQLKIKENGPVVKDIEKKSDIDKICILCGLTTFIPEERDKLNSAVRNITNLKGEDFQNAFETLRKTSQERDILSALDKDVRQNFLIKCILEAPNENGYEMIRYESTQRQYLDEIAEKIDLGKNIDKLFEKPNPALFTKFSGKEAITREDLIELTKAHEEAKKVMPALFTEFSGKEAITRNDLIELIKALEEAEKVMPRVYTGKRYEYLEVSNKLQEFLKEESSESTLNIEEVLKLIKIVDEYSRFFTNQFFTEKENLTYAQNRFKEGIAKLGKWDRFDKPTYRKYGSYYLDLYFAGIMQAVREKKFDNFDLLYKKYRPIEPPKHRGIDFYESWDTYTLFLRECSGDELLTVIKWSSKRNEFYCYNAYQLVNKLIEKKTDEESVIRNLFQIIWNHAHPISFLKALHSPLGSLKDVFKTLTTKKQFEIAKKELAESNKTIHEKYQYEKNIDKIYDEKFPK